MTKSVFRGLLIAAFFAVVAFALVPVYVPRPAFIPGFAPPPDMWPRLTAITGIGLSVIAAFLPPAIEPPIEGDGSPMARKIVRAVVLFAAFFLYLTLVPWIGFLASTILLTLAAIALTGERTRVLWALGIGVIGTILVMMFFQSALGTQFPAGQLVKLLGL